MSQKVIRKLTTILAADAQAFSTAMTRDELGTYTELQAARDVFFKLIERHGGRVANTAGDGLIADFPSVVEAVQCAIEVQQELNLRQSALPFRIGIHLGDVICDGDDLIGEGVNLAARLQTMADPGGVLISQQVLDHVRNKLSIGFEFLGEKRPHNLPDHIAIYRLTLGEGTTSPPPSTQPKAARSGPKSQVAQVWSDPDLGSADPASAAMTPEHLAAEELAMADADPEFISGHQSRQSQKDMDFQRRLRFEKRPRRAKNPQDSQHQLRVIGIGTGVVVALNVLSGGTFWLAWPILCIAALYGLRNGNELLGRTHLYGIPFKRWIISGFLICVNLMSWSGTPWAIWPVGALFAVSLLFRPKSAD